MTTLVYIGNGAAFIGVPARNLTKAEVEALPDGITLERLLDSGLYKHPVEYKKQNEPTPKKVKVSKESE